ncbi:MAG: YheC/YheD family protein [Kyrpidia sp.]|nr:YheC/YheD family protein [Kyrpidia sp.]
MKLAILVWERSGKPVGNLRLCGELAATGARRGWRVVLLSPAGLLARTPREYRWNGRNWIASEFTGAEAVYNRVPHRRFEADPIFHSATTFLKERGIALWNPGFLCKDRVVHCWLSHPDLALRVPETHRWPLPLSALQVSGEWMLKPCDGRIGDGIIHVARLSDRKFLWRWQNRGQTETGRGDVQRCRAFLNRRTCGRPYLVQSKIPLATWRNLAFDLRMLWQKDALGRWRHRGVGARVAGKGRITTHVPWGGRVADPVLVLRDVFGTRAEKVLEEAMAVASLAVNHLDGADGGRWGEMSVDLGCDSGGNCWLFEANAKPMRFDEPSIREAHLHGVFETANWAAGRLSGSGRTGPASLRSAPGRGAEHPGPPTIRD